ncbi:MAG: 30S ribosomal protein S11 [Candidatus Berkelbacteria bacterium]|nr:MAG: 30S ribosomal protein S11 [Candidatus Berkelbacteria bacterium]QQG52118.1 MAG: 30S ribosomal protein S11 [Candidatus Berkelbacteria bacterium]
MATKTQKSAPKSRKPVEKVEEIRLSIHASFNNTIITASSFRTGRVLGWASSGGSGFKGTKKGTPYAAGIAMKNLLDKIAPYEPQLAHVFVSGAGNGRDAALRAIVGTGLKTVEIKDVTPLPHNGCRPKKARRV